MDQLMMLNIGMTLTPMIRWKLWCYTLSGMINGDCYRPQWNDGHKPKWNDGRIDLCIGVEAHCLGEQPITFRVFLQYSLWIKTSFSWHIPCVVGYCHLLSIINNHLLLSLVGIILACTSKIRLSLCRWWSTNIVAIWPSLSLPTTGGTKCVQAGIHN